MVRQTIKYLVYSIFLLTPILSKADSCCDYTSKTFFSVRPQFGIASPEQLSMWRGTQRLAEGALHRGTFQAEIFGGTSTHRAKLGTYFMPFCSNKASVTSIVTTADDALFAQNFNIPAINFAAQVLNNAIIQDGYPLLANPFDSIIEINPRQSVAGIGFSYQHVFCVHNVAHWIRINAPIEYVRNNMHLQERILASDVYQVKPIAGTNLADQQQNMMQALSQKQWEYGKIDNKKHSKSGIPFIQIQFGEVSINSECFYIAPYIGIDIPTGSKVHGKYIFEPVVGNGRHAGIFWGLNSEFIAWQDACDLHQLVFAIDINMEYLFKSTQRRSFDLKNRPWSRYIETYANLAQATEALNLVPGAGGGGNILQAIFLNTPGINTLTQKVSVAPGFNFTGNFALIYNQCEPCGGWNAEVGYNFYAREAECIQLKHDFETTVAIKDHVGMGLTNPIRTITQDQFSNEATLFDSLLVIGNQLSIYPFAIITQNDLDLQSAAHPTTLAHIVYGTAGYHWDDLCNPVMASIGLSYEFNGKYNAALNRVLVWARAGVSF